MWWWVGRLVGGRTIIILFRLKYVHWLQKFIAVDIYGECGPLSCGTSRNMGHTYRLEEDPCYNMVNKNYR